MITKSIDKFTHIPKEYLSLRPPFPKSLKIETTNVCNLNCKFCANKEGKRPKSFMEKDFVIELIDRVKKNGVKKLGLFYLGEPFLDKNIPIYIKHAKEKGINYVFLTTNGKLCTPENLKEICEAGLDSLKFSINDLSTLDSIKWMKNYPGKKPKVYASTIGVNLPLMKAVEPFVDEVYALFKYNQAGRFKGFPNIGRIGNPTSPVPCWTLFTEAKIAVDGNMTACCFDHDGDFDGYNLREHSMMEAWHHPKFVELRRQHLEHEFDKSLCKKCLEGYI